MVRTHVSLSAKSNQFFLGVVPPATSECPMTLLGHQLLITSRLKSFTQSNPCLPSCQQSPGALTETRLCSGNLSAGSCATSPDWDRPPIRRSISPISKPVASRLKFKSISVRDLNCSPSRVSFHAAFSVSLLSAMTKALICAGGFNNSLRAGNNPPADGYF